MLRRFFSLFEVSRTEGSESEKFQRLADDAKHLTDQNVTTFEEIRLQLRLETTLMIFDMIDGFSPDELADFEATILPNLTPGMSTQVQMKIAIKRHGAQRVVN